MRPASARRLRHGEDRAVVLGSGVVAGDGPSRPALLRLVVPRQVAADRGPGLPAVPRAEQHVAAVVDGLRVVRRDRDRGRPLEAVAGKGRPVPGGVVRPGGDVARLPRAVVVARQDPEVLARVHDVGVGGVGHRVARLAAADRVPVAVRDAGGGQAVARPRGGAQVLHRAEDPVRHRRVGRHVVELRDRQHRRVPRRPAVGRDVHPAVVRGDHPLRVRGIDPHVVVVAVVDALHALDRLAAVHRLQHAAPAGTTRRRGSSGRP